MIVFRQHLKIETFKLRNLNGCQCKSVFFSIRKKIKKIELSYYTSSKAVACCKQIETFKYLNVIHKEKI